MTAELRNQELAIICPDPVIGINRQGIITLFNPAAERLLGYSAEKVIGIFSVADLFPSEGIAREIKRQMYLDGSSPRGQVSGYRTSVKAANGGQVPIELSALALERDGEEIGSIGFFRDLTERLSFEQSLKLLSITDSLTGLYNQRHFQPTLNQEVERCKRYRSRLSLLYIDLDNFKQVNDTLGHVEGDWVLRYTAEALNVVVRASDLAFRYGGDEFLLLLPETSLQGAKLQATRLIDYFERHIPSNLVNINQVSCPVSLSIGVAEYSDDESPEQLMRRADLAMYEAKKRQGCALVLAN